MVAPYLLKADPKIAKKAPYIAVIIAIEIVASSVDRFYLMRVNESWRLARCAPEEADTIYRGASL